MKDIILKPGSFSTVVKTSHSSDTPGQSLEDYVVQLLKSPTCCAKYITLTKGTVVQSGTSAVSVNTGAGVISTSSQAVAANASYVVTVNNSLVKADSVIVANLMDLSAALTAGAVLTAYVEDVVAGQFKIVIANGGSATQLAAIYKLSFIVL
jgi:uncharacterized membrane protein YczE